MCMGDDFPASFFSPSVRRSVFLIWESRGDIGSTPMVTPTSAPGLVKNLLRGPSRRGRSGGSGVSLA